jgi:hypothetical protein
MEPEADLSCAEAVGGGRSGRCQCAAPPALAEAVRAAGGYLYAREHRHIDPSHNITHAGRRTCAHEGGATCGDACLDAWRVETVRVAAWTEAMEAAAAADATGAAEAGAYTRSHFSST